MRVALIFFLCLLGQVALAAEIKLKDGSIIFGTIERLEDGEDLYVDTKHMGEVKIEWDSVIEIDKHPVVQVEFFDGSRLIGNLTMDITGVTIVDEKKVLVQPHEVFAVSKVNETFGDSLSANVDLGLNVVRGNNQVTQLSFGGGIGYETTRFETGLVASMILNEQTDTVDTRRFTMRADYGHKFNRGWQANGFYQFESDEQQELDGRSLFGGTLSNRVINQRKHRLELYGGLAVNVENFADSPRNETLEGIVGASYRLRSKADADVVLSVLPNLEESGRVRVQFDGSLSFDLFSDFDIKFTVYDRYDSKPPAGNEKNDSGVTLGLSWER